MHTHTLFSRWARTGARLVMLASMLMAALISSVTPAIAAVSGITIGSQSGTLSYASAAGSATYSVTVTRSAGTPTSFTLSMAGLPAGVSFSPAGPTSFSGNASRTVTLTLTKTASTSIAAGTYPFTIRASTGTGVPSANGSLVISQAGQSISFAALPSKTMGSPDFAVSATGGASGNPVTFTAAPAGVCSMAGAASVHLVGAGSCTITAAQAGNTNYSAAASVARTFAVLAPAGPTVTFDLYAVAGTTTLPGSLTVPVWGYNTSNAAVTKPGGPVLIVNQNANVVVTLHNQLAESTALVFQGQSMIPDTAGASAGGSSTYSFVARQPGTFLYEAGLIAGAQHQVAMGLYGALIVRPTGFASAPGQAYGSAASAFNTEQVLVLSELDTALNTSSTPASFDMRKYSPKYYLINGQAYPNTPNLSVAAGDKVLLRYVDAGLQAHAMSTLGLSQLLVGQDGSAAAYPHTVVAETIAPGQTLDAIVTIPASAALGAQFPVYDASLFLRNNKGTATNAGLGGMLTFLTAGTGTPPPPADTGPSASLLGLSPNPTNGSVPVTVIATITDVAPNATTISAAEFYIDSTASSPNTMTAVDTSFDATTEAVTGSISASTLTSLASGNHTIYVRGRDSASNWGSFASIVLNLDKAGPTTSALSLAPNPANGTANVSLIGTANDSATGNHNIAAAEYAIDGGAAVPMTVNTTSAPIAGLSATISAATVNALGAGTHTISVRSQDASLNWGAPATTTLNVDQTGPATMSVSASPNPNNGSTPYNSSVPAVRVFASFSDASSGNSNLSNAEGFLDAAGTTGTGFVFIATDGNFNSPAESGYADIPLPVVNTLSPGAHPICIHAKDASGNWGAVDCSYSLTIDRTPPAISSIVRADANPANNGSVHFLVTFSESVTGVAASNFAIVRTGLTGTSAITSVAGGGNAWTVAVTTGTGTGTLGLNLSSATGIADLAGNALPSAGLPFVGQVYTIQPPPQPAVYFSTFGNTNPPSVGGTADDADIYFYNGSAFSRSIDVTAVTSPLPTGANVDGFDRVDATHFYMSFNGQVAVPGIGNVQDEDVVFYNAGTWSLFFDGSVNGVTSNLDAISIVGGNLYFSLSTNTTPPGVTGPAGDDADIYRWNGGSSYTRMFDATANGLATTANVDGFVWVDATHFYLSFADPVALPGGAGTAQDEDVVLYSAGAWSIYFDGSVVGLDTSGNLDIDAFDLP